MLVKGATGVRATATLLSQCIWNSNFVFGIQTLSFDCRNLLSHHLLMWQLMLITHQAINILRPRQNGRHFTDNPFKHIFFNETVRISIKISLKFVSKGHNNNIPASVQIMAWCQPGNNSLSVPMTVRLPRRICVIWTNDGHGIAIS